MILPKRHVLVAENDPSIRKMMKLRLEHEGFCVYLFGDAEGALQEAEKKEHPIDLVVLDIKMSGMTGYELCRRLRTIAALAKVPILIMSGTESQLAHLADRCIEVGASDWIRKPFQSRDLMNKIQHLLHNGEETDSNGR